MQEYRKISAENLYKMIRKYQSATFSMAIASKNNACVTITLQTKLIHLTYNSKRDIPVISSDVNSGLEGLGSVVLMGKEYEYGEEAGTTYRKLYIYSREMEACIKILLIGPV